MTSGHRQAFIEDLTVGRSESAVRRVSAADIAAFAEVSGDDNPLHLDAAYAAGTIFRQPIAHGMLTASLFSMIIGTRMPGTGTIYLSQALRFKGPVRIDDEVTATVTVAAIDPVRRRVELDCACHVNGAVVLEGEASVLVPSRG